MSAGRSRGGRWRVNRIRRGLGLDHGGRSAEQGHHPRPAGGGDRVTGRPAPSVLPPSLRPSLGPVAVLAALVVVVLGALYSGHSAPGTVDSWIRPPTADSVRAPWRQVALALDFLGNPRDRRWWSRPVWSAVWCFGVPVRRCWSSPAPARPWGPPRCSSMWWAGPSTAPATCPIRAVTPPSPPRSPSWRRCSRRTGSAWAGEPVRHSCSRRGWWPARSWAGRRSGWARTTRPTPSAAGAPRWR